MPNDFYDEQAHAQRPPLTEAQRQWYARQQAAAPAAPPPFSRTAQEPVPSGSVTIRQAPSPVQRPAAQPAPAAKTAPNPAPVQRPVSPAAPAARPAPRPASPAPAANAAQAPRPAAPAAPTARPLQTPRPTAQAAPAAVQRPPERTAPAPTARPAPAVQEARARVQGAPSAARPAAKPLPPQQPAGRRINRPPRTAAAPAPAPQTPVQAAPVPVPPPAPPAAEAPVPQSAVPTPAQEVPTKAAPAAKPRKAAKKSAKKAPKAKKPLPPALAVVRKILRALGYIVFTPVKLAALALIPLCVFWYDYTIDRNGWFQGSQYEREVAQALLDGHCITNYEQMEEREIVKLYAQNLDTAPTSVSLGSSRILQLTRELAGDEGFFNAGMIGAEYSDVYDSYYLFDRVGLIPGTVILEIDPWIFSGFIDANRFSRTDMQMWNEYQRYILGRTDIEVTQATENMNFWMALTSPAFFHETIDYYIDNKENGLRPQILEGDYRQERGEVKMPDGSVWYGLNFREMSQMEVNEAAVEQFTASLINCEGFFELDPEHVELFRQFVDYVRSRGSQIVFFLTPYHPQAYDWILNFPQRYSGFFQVEPWVRRYAAEQGIPVYGSYDPQVCSCGEEDFFDAWHVRDTGIVKFFPGVAAINAAREAGTLPDPLAVQPRMPTATEDPIL